MRRARAALTGPGATKHHPQASPDPPGAASEPPRRRTGRNLALALGPARNGHPFEGAAEQPGDHAAAARRNPAHSAHASHTPSRAVGVPDRLRVPDAAPERRSGRCGPAGAPDRGPVGGASATRRRHVGGVHDCERGADEAGGTGCR